MALRDFTYGANFAAHFPDFFYIRMGGSENSIHAKHLSENISPLPSICAGAIWLTMVGGYIEESYNSSVRYSGGITRKATAGL